MLIYAAAYLSIFRIMEYKEVFDTIRRFSTYRITYLFFGLILGFIIGLNTCNDRNSKNERIIYVPSVSVDDIDDQIKDHRESTQVEIENRIKSRENEDIEDLGKSLANRLGIRYAE